MGICQISKKIKTRKITKTVKMLKVKMLSNKCNNNPHFKEGKISLKEKDF